MLAATSLKGAIKNNLRSGRCSKYRQALAAATLPRLATAGHRTPMVDAARSTSLAPSSPLAPAITMIDTSVGSMVITAVPVGTSSRHAFG